MKAKTIILSGTISVLLVLLITSLTHSEIGFNLFMCDAMAHNVARIALTIGLLSLLVIKRPRPLYFRVALGAVGTFVTAFALSQTIDYHLGFIDGLAYFLGSVALLVEAFEPQLQGQSSPAGMLS
ncbi:MAG: hypothetical protein WAW62_01315 [Candidatus Saccharimonas aalborgensis]